MERRRNEQPNFDINPVFAVAHWLLANIRMALYFFLDVVRPQHLERFLQFLQAQRVAFSESARQGFEQLSKGKLIHEINEYVGGLLRFSTRNAGRVQLVESAVEQSLVDVLQGDTIPLQVQRRVNENMDRLEAAYYQQLDQYFVNERAGIPLPEPSFEEKMNSQLNNIATHVGPVRQFGGCFSRQRVSTSSEESIDASNSPREFGFPPFEVRSSRVSSQPMDLVEDNSAPLQQDLSISSHDERESLPDSFMQDDDDETLTLENVEQLQDDRQQPLVMEFRSSTSQQSSSQRTETVRTSDVSKKIVTSQTYSQNYFFSVETPSESLPSDSKEEFFQKVKQTLVEDLQKVDNNSNTESFENDANVKRIMGKLGIIQNETADVDRKPPQSNNQVENFDEIFSDRREVHAERAQHHPHQGKSRETSHLKTPADFYDGVNEECALCKNMINSYHEVLNCSGCFCSYHAKCFAYAAYRYQKCSYCDCRFHTSRSPFD